MYLKRLACLLISLFASYMHEYFFEGDIQEKSRQLKEKKKIFTEDCQIFSIC